LYDNDFSWPETFDNGLRLKDFLEDSVDEKYYLSGEKADKVIQAIGFIEEPTGIDLSVNSPELREFANCISARQDRGISNNIPKILELAKLNPNRHSSVMNSVVDPNGLCACLDTMGGGNREPKIIERAPLKFLDRNGKQTDGDYAFCVDTAQTGGVMEDRTRIRKLTPKECWRLMGFDDVDFEKAEKVNCTSQLYKQAGNSIVVDVLEHIFNNVLKEELEIQEMLR